MLLFIILLKTIQIVKLLELKLGVSFCHIHEDYSAQNLKNNFSYLWIKELIEMECWSIVSTFADASFIL